MNLLPTPFLRLFTHRTLTPAVAEKIGMLYEAEHTFGAYPLRTFLLNSVQRSVRADLVQCDRILRSLRRHVDVAERIVLDLLRYDVVLAQEIFSQTLFADELALVAKLWNAHRSEREPARHRHDPDEELCRRIDEAIASGLTTADPKAVMAAFDLVREPHGKDWALRERNAVPGSGGCIRVVEPVFSVDVHEFIRYAFDGTDRDWWSVQFRFDDEGHGIDTATAEPLPFGVRCLTPGRLLVGGTTYELRPAGEITAYVFPERYRPLATFVRTQGSDAWRIEPHSGIRTADEPLAEMARYLSETGNKGTVVATESGCRISVRTAADEGVGQLVSVTVKRCFEAYAVHTSGSRRLLFRRFGI